MIGQVVGSYRIVAELGKGGMGVVYRAEHVQLGRPAALKMLLPSLSTEPAIVQRFFNEAKAASAIDHPGIVEIYDFGTHSDGSAYIVMALLKGESLEQRLKRGPVSPTDSANIVAQVAGALSAAHDQQIVHRDLKPDNIFLVPNDLMPGGIQVKLLDFGIAKLADDKASGVKTQTGALIGTPAYMSPEQCMGQTDIDHRTDLYSVGCILFHLMTGRPPFLSEHGTGMMIAAHIRDPAPSPRSLNPAIPEPMEAIILRLLEKDPAARFQSANELRAALVGAGASAPSTWRGRAPQSMEIAATMPPPSTGPEAYAATSADTGQPQAGDTTRGGAAAELVSAAGTAPGQRRSRGWLLGLGLLLLAGAGVGGFLLVRSSQTADEDDAEVAAASAQAADPIAEAPQPAGELPTLPPIQPPADEPCPDGLVRGPDTRGNCCWPGQAWSTAKESCVGIPSCPDGTVADGESCAAVKVAAREKVEKKPEPASKRPPPDPDPPGRTAPPSSSSKAPTFKLGKRTFDPGEKFAIKFAGPVTSSGRNRAWITIVEEDKPDARYGAWTYIKDGASSAELKAPGKPGAYEVRLHTHYPAKPNNVVQRIKVTVGAPTPEPESGETPATDQRFSLASSVVAPGADIAIRFPAPMVAAKGERFWITVVEADKPDHRYGQYKYLPPRARSISLRAPRTPGAYEVRLHANYPKKSTNLVHRVAVTVE